MIFADLCKLSFYLVLVMEFHCIVGKSPLNWDAAMPDTCFGHRNYTKSDSPINLHVMLHISAIYDVSEEKMEYGMQLVMTELWEDDHLKADMLIGESGDDDVASEIIPQEVVDCLWQPDTIFGNIKESKLYDATFKNKILKITFPFYFISRSTRYKLTVACSMDFHIYPLDSQLCPLELFLMASRASDVEMTWFNLPFGNLKNITFFNEIKPLNFHIQLLPVSYRYVEYSPTEITKILCANLLFVRSLTASIVNTYIPSTLVVSLSMVSFWLDITAVPGRITLGVTSILTLSTEIVHARSALPTLDYMTAMDAWLLGCMFTVFMSLIEFTLAQSLSRKVTSTENRTIVKVKSDPRIVNRTKHWWSIRSRKLSPFLINPKRYAAADGRKKSQKSNDNVLDRASRIVFPTSFAIFSITYFTYFYKKAYPK